MPNSSRYPWKLLVWAVAATLPVAVSGWSATPPKKAEAGMPIRFQTERPGQVFINLYNPDGTLLRRLVSAGKMSAGAHVVPWDGLDEKGKAVPEGEYSWRGVVHEGIGLKLRGWAANGGQTPWGTPDGKGSWGGDGSLGEDANPRDAGVPSAVAADAQWVYLGWSMATLGKAILACDLEGRVLWSHRREEGPSGCKALAVDDGVLYVLGGVNADAEGGSIYKLDVKTGRPLPWPNGQVDLKIAPLWPADSVEKPAKADGMAVRHGHIYLTFTKSQFLTVLDAKSGDYLQTVVGAAPGLIDVAPTKTELPNEPGKLVDADFALISLPGGVLGKVLFAHEPLWVVMSDLTSLDRDLRITALSVMGDGAKHHRHTAFLGLGAPFHQVQARPLLDTDTPTWVAGQPGGRPLLGPWQADAVRAVRGVALAADGKLWVAEGDAFPKRFSVWDTSGEKGKLVNEFFGPASMLEGGAINPLDPDLMFGQGCEWRIDRKTGRAKCLGVVTREPTILARFGVGKNGHAYLIVRSIGYGPLSIFERMGDGDYRLRTRIYQVSEDGSEVTAGHSAKATQTIFWSDENGDGKEQPAERQTVDYAIDFFASFLLQNLGLVGEVSENKTPHAFVVPIVGWTACDAPQYDLTKAVHLPVGVGSVSADTRFVLLPGLVSGKPDACYEVASGKKVWESAAGLLPLAIDSARLAAPLNNVWTCMSADGSWRLMNEDGFELTRWFIPETDKSRWPQKAIPGADMTGAGVSGLQMGSLTQTSDGRLYLQTGESAYWNLEVTGLDKVKALPGGTITVPVK